MTRSLDEISGLSALDAKVLTGIHTEGWQTTGVFAREGEGGPDWAYSIGLFHSLHHPEVIFFGLPMDNCIKAVNVIGIDIKDGMRYQPERPYSGILQLPHTCAFKEVHTNHYRDYVGYALWFYEEDPFPLLQCFWSDEEGRFPWEEGCSEYAREAQPLLYLP
jgi:hypothetical protein